MSSDGGPERDDDESLVPEDIEATKIFDAYRAATPTGQPIDWAPLLAEHPALADRLRSLIAAENMIAAVAGDVIPDFEDYRIVREIGRGGMGIVYEADRISRGRHVAIKVLTAAAAMDPQQLKRFLQVEVPAAQLLRHPHIVPIIDVGFEQGVYYYAMQFIGGQNLAQLIKSLPANQGGNQDSSQAPWTTRGTDRSLLVTQWGLQAAEALNFAHEQGVLHRDIKPSNLLLDDRCNVWITDFGLAHIQGEAHLTGTGDLTGTPRYMSPEQVQGKRVVVDHRTDIYSLGVTLYELLTSCPAIEGDSPQDVMRRVVEQEPPAPRHINPDIPRDLETIVLKAMTKEREDRYQSARELADDLRRFLDRKPIKARRPSPLDRASRWARVHRRAVATSLALLLTGVVGLSVAVVLIARAERRAGEYARESRYESLLAQIQRDRLAPHVIGWRDEVWRLVREAALLRPTENAPLNAQASMTLMGMDARVIKRLPEPAPSLAFDPHGKRLFTGGNGKLQIWDTVTGQVEVIESPVVGPIAVRSDGTPCQLGVKTGEKDDRPTLQLWSALDRRIIRSFEAGGGSKGRIIAHALSANGRLVGALSGTPSDRTITVWKAESGTVSFTTRQTMDNLAFSPDADLLAAWDGAGHITLWKMPQGEPFAALTAGKTPVQCIAFGRKHLLSASGTASNAWLLAAGDFGGTVTVWDLQSKLPINYCRGSQYQVYAVAFSADGTTLATAGRARAKLWDTATGHLLLSLELQNTMNGVAFSPYGTLLAVGGQPAFINHGGVDVFRIEDGHGIRTLRGLKERVSKSAFSSDGRLVACLSQDWWIAVWQRASGRLLHLIDAPHGTFADNACLAFSPDGRRLTFSSGREARLWDLETGTVLGKWPLPEGLADALAFQGPERLLLLRMETMDETATPDSRFPPESYPRVLRLRDLLGVSPAKPLRVIEDFNWSVYRIHVSPDGRHFVAEGRSGPRGEKRTVNLYQGATGKKVWAFPSQKPWQLNSLLLFDPFGEVLAISGKNDDKVMLLETPTGVALGHIEDPDVMSLSPRAKRWLSFTSSKSGSMSGEYTLHDRDHAGPLLRVTDNSEWTTSQFSPDGECVIWGNTDGSVTLCDLKEAQERLAEVGLGW